MVVTIWIFDALGESVHVVNTFKKLRCKQHISKFKGNSCVHLSQHIFYIIFGSTHLLSTYYVWEARGLLLGRKGQSLCPNEAYI